METSWSFLVRCLALLWGLRFCGDHSLPDSQQGIFPTPPWGTLLVTEGGGMDIPGESRRREKIICWGILCSAQAPYIALRHCFQGSEPCCNFPMVTNPCCLLHHHCASFFQRGLHGSTACRTHGSEVLLPQKRVRSLQPLIPFSPFLSFQESLFCKPVLLSL